LSTQAFSSQAPKNFRLKETVVLILEAPLELKIQDFYFGLNASQLVDTGIKFYTKFLNNVKLLRMMHL